MGVQWLPVLIVHDMTNTLGCSDIMTSARGEKRSLSVQALKASLAGFKANSERLAVRLAGCIVTGLPIGQDKYDEAAGLVRTALDDLGVYTAALLPEDPRMNRLTMAEVAKGVDASVLCGHDALATTSVEHVEMGTRQLPDMLRLLQDRPSSLIIQSSKRFGFLLGMLMADQSANGPKFGGILLCGQQQSKVLPADQQHVLVVLVTPPP